MWHLFTGLDVLPRHLARSKTPIPPLLHIQAIISSWCVSLLSSFPTAAISVGDAERSAFLPFPQEPFINNLWGFHSLSHHLFSHTLLLSNSQTVTDNTMLSLCWWTSTSCLSHAHPKTIVSFRGESRWLIRFRQQDTPTDDSHYYHQAKEFIHDSHPARGISHGKHKQVNQRM